MSKRPRKVVLVDRLPLAEASEVVGEFCESRGSRFWGSFCQTRGEAIRFGKHLAMIAWLTIDQRKGGLYEVEEEFQVSRLSEINKKNLGQSVHLNGRCRTPWVAID